MACFQHGTIVELPARDVVTRSAGARSPWTRVRDAAAAFLATPLRSAAPYF